MGSLIRPFQNSSQCLERLGIWHRWESPHAQTRSRSKFSPPPGNGLAERTTITTKPLYKHMIHEVYPWLCFKRSHSALSKTTAGSCCEVMDMHACILHWSPQRPLPSAMTHSLSVHVHFSNSAGIRTYTCMYVHAFTIPLGHLTIGLSKFENQLFGFYSAFFSVMNFHMETLYYIPEAWHIFFQEHACAVQLSSGSVWIARYKPWTIWQPLSLLMGEGPASW